MASRTRPPDDRLAAALSRVTQALSEDDSVDITVEPTLLIVTPAGSAWHGTACMFTADENDLPVSMSNAAKARACESAAESTDDPVAARQFRRMGRDYRSRPRRQRGARLTLQPRTRSRSSHRTRPGHRRSGSTSTPSSGDPGGSSSDDEGPAAPILIRGGACPRCAAPLHTDRDGADHCGGCAITWWEGVR